MENSRILVNSKVIDASKTCIGSLRCQEFAVTSSFAPGLILDTMASKFLAIDLLCRANRARVSDMPKSKRLSLHRSDWQP